jgi:hypothetical protein
VYCTPDAQPAALTPPKPELQGDHSLETICRRLEASDMRPVFVPLYVPFPPAMARAEKGVGPLCRWKRTSGIPCRRVGYDVCGIVRPGSRVGGHRRLISRWRCPPRRRQTSRIRRVQVSGQWSGRRIDGRGMSCVQIGTSSAVVPEPLLIVQQRSRLEYPRKSVTHARPRVRASRVALDSGNARGRCRVSLVAFRVVHG